MIVFIKSAFKITFAVKLFKTQTHAKFFPSSFFVANLTLFFGQKKDTAFAKISILCIIQSSH